MGGSASYRQARKIREQEERPSGPYSNKYEQERLDKAIWTKDKDLVDDTFRSATGSWWNGLSHEEKKASYDFTGMHYHFMNLALGGAMDPNQIKDETVVRINNLTNALDKSAIPTDIWVRRGVSSSHIGRMVGLDKTTSKNKDLVVSEIQKAIDNDKIFDIKNFMSTGATSDTGFDDSFEMKIFVPKGSKGVYAEPFSAHSGSHDGMKWDGVTKQSYFGGEFEILLQRGYKLKPIQYNSKGGRNGRNQIVFTIVGQEAKPYVKPVQ